MLEQPQLPLILQIKLMSLLRVAPRDVDEAVRKFELEHAALGQSARLFAESLLAEEEARQLGDVPRTVGPYELGAPLDGRSGRRAELRGRVFRACHLSDAPRDVALKVIPTRQDEDELRRRFEFERLIHARMHHEAVARISDAGTADGFLYLAVELVENAKGITTYCDEEKLTIEDRLSLFRDVCRGVHHAHRRGVIHRDLKPSNILVHRQGTQHVVKIIDFGIAKPHDDGDELHTHAWDTQTGLAVGTAAYMAPEQGMGENIDVRADVYSLGVVLYELLSGVHPSALLVKGARPEAIFRDIQEQDMPAPSQRLVAILRKDAVAIASKRRLEPRQLRQRLKGNLDAIVLKAAAKVPSSRYTDPGALGDDIARHLDGRAANAIPSRAFRARKFVRRHRLAAALALVVVVSGLWIWRTDFLERQTTARLGGLFQIEMAENDLTRLLPFQSKKLQLADAWERKHLPTLREWQSNLRRFESATVFSAPSASPWLSDRQPAIRRVFARLQKRLDQFLDREAMFVSRSITWARFEQRHERGEAYRQAWDHALRDLAVHPRYAGTIPNSAPQTGLWPLGENPGTGLWEFAHLRSAWNPDEPPHAAFDTVGELTADEILARNPMPDDPIILVLIPAGRFFMGTDKKTLTWNGTTISTPSTEIPRHSVTIQRPFFLSKYETTRAQWARHQGMLTPKNRKENEESLIPIASKTWLQIFRFCQENGLSLPTEAQWECVARADGDDIFPSAISNILDERNVGDWDGTPALWNDGHHGPAPIGSFDPNCLGLFDVIGNVWEWCLDYKVNYADGERLQKVDPRTTLRMGKFDKNVRIYRGGGAAEGPLISRPGQRRSGEIDNFQRGTLGFRTARIWE